MAADATCARLMGLVPERVPHIAEGQGSSGTCRLTELILT
jgi:hypothetical protein